MMRIDSFPVEVSRCFRILSVCLEVTIFVRQVFDLLVITDLAKDSGFASFGLSTGEFNKCSFIQRWWEADMGYGPRQGVRDKA